MKCIEDLQTTLISVMSVGADCANALGVYSSGKSAVVAEFWEVCERAEAVLVQTRLRTFSASLFRAQTRIALAASAIEGALENGDAEALDLPDILFFVESIDRIEADIKELLTKFARKEQDKP